MTWSGSRRENNFYTPRFSIKIAGKNKRKTKRKEILDGNGNLQNLRIPLLPNGGYYTSVGISNR